MMRQQQHYDGNTALKLTPAESEKESRRCFAFEVLGPAKSDQLGTLTYGNGAVTTFAYNALNRRLAHITVNSHGGIRD